MPPRSLQPRCILSVRSCSQASTVSRDCAFVGHAADSLIASTLYASQKEEFDRARSKTFASCGSHSSLKMPQKGFAGGRETNFFGWCWGLQDRVVATDRVA